jgi:hypothetical protein
MAARYRRALSHDAFSALLPKGEFGFLLSDLPSDDPYAIDIQLREDDTLMYYHGTTSLLTIALNAVGGRIKPKATAHERYRKLPAYKELKESLAQGKYDKFREAFPNYLSIAKGASNTRSYCKEALWQNRLCVDWGRRSQPSEEYLVIDRECVVGFGPEGRDGLYDSVFERYAGIQERLQKSSPSDFGEFRKKSFGDNVDMLALDEQRNMAVIELKHGTNATGIYWGPLQVLAYRDAFKAKLDDITQDIRSLVSQKVDLKLIPPAAMSRLPDGKFTSVKAVLVIAEPKPKSKCWDRLKLVISETLASGLIVDKSDVRIIKLPKLDDRTRAAG